MDLSIVIPARNEMFLTRTVEGLLDNIRGDTEIIVMCDGNWPNPPIKNHPRVVMVHHSESIGQRAIQNEGVKISKAKYVMKMDAHVLVDEGFDVKLMADMQDDWTVVPLMKNLHAFDWICKKCGERWYQGPDPTKCDKCDNTTDFERDIIWIPKKSPNSTSYRFNRELRFKYFSEYKKHQIGDLVESMSLQGSCFMATREKYWEIELCDESWGSWGQQGSEVALKTWLSGGKVICNKKTWYAHLFRTRKGFNWPYPMSGRSQEKARKICQDIFLNDRWDKAIYPLSWLIEKFAPVPDWEGYGQTKGVVYYTDNQLDEEIMAKCQKQLKKSFDEESIVSVSLLPTNLGRNIVLPLERGYLTMFKQILAGLEAIDTEVVFFCEHDVLYSASHFEFTPIKENVFYYNTNVWRLRFEDGLAVRTDDTRSLSCLCAYRELLIEHYKKRIEIVERDGYSNKMGFEPGTHGRIPELNGISDRWESKIPNVDIRHSSNATASRWSPEEYRNKKFAEGWREIRKIPGWGSLRWIWKKI